MPPRRSDESLQRGAVVVGGDYQGLGIIRSLGRTGFPVCVLDDEPSIGRYSRYVTHAIRVQNLREEEAIVNTLLDVGRRLNLKGWVVFATRDELVTSLSRARDRLSEFFRVPTERGRGQHGQAAAAAARGDRGLAHRPRAGPGRGARGSRAAGADHRQPGGQRP